MNNILYVNIYEAIRILLISTMSKREVIQVAESICSHTNNSLCYESTYNSKGATCSQKSEMKQIRKCCVEYQSLSQKAGEVNGGRL